MSSAVISLCQDFVRRPRRSLAPLAMRLSVGLLLAGVGVLAGAGRSHAATPPASPASPPAVAADEDQTLVMALSSAPDSLDPYYHNLAPNLVISGQVFDSLIAVDSHRRLIPALAVSWQPIAEDQWEIKLRPNVRFHDGSTFDAQDVLASWARVPTVTGPSSFTVFTETVKSITVIDPLTLHLQTHGPFPLLPAYLTQVAIIPAEQEKTLTAAFNDGSAVIGTGPYRYQAGSAGHTLVLSANAEYWGGKPEWDTVEIRFIPNDADRVTALIGGTVDLINAVPPADVQRLEGNPSLRVSKVVSDRVIYLSVDFDRPQTPFAHSADGQLLAENPFHNLLVRQAISTAINRQAIIDELLYGQGEPAGQLVPTQMDGASAHLKVQKFDLAKARELLKKAGYPDGFVTVLHGPNNRYVRDADIARSVALMLTGAGIATSAETFPAGEFFPRNKKREFSFTLRGWSSDTGEAGYSVKALMATRDVDAGRGTANHSRYSNPELDALMNAADRELDPAKRRALVQKAMELGINDLGQIPLHFQMNIWASRKGVSMVPRTDELTFIRDIHPSP
jgi:peptide/nickel transport system substrate-binding protein